ncbi:MAG TPA: hypothetical protein PKD97_11715 [Ferruginibacter sp.]|nr:hypothetical protein [Ferruginibacter sp.]
MKALFTFSLLFISGFIFAQKPPLIGSEKGVKEKFILIKKGLPDIKKNLTENDENFVEDYNVKFEMGNGIVLFDEDEKEQTLLIRFSTEPYFSGTANDFQDYYYKLVGLLNEVFGAELPPTSNNKEKKLTTLFLQKGTDIFTSKLGVIIQYTQVLNDPYIEINVFSNKPFD